MNLIGMFVETEILALHLKEVKPRYMEKVQQQIKEECSKSARHIRRKFNTFADDVGVEFTPLAEVERFSIGKILFKLLEPAGLFDIATESAPSKKRSRSCYVITPSKVLIDHYKDMENHLNAHIHYPVMFCKPRDWSGQFDGGYYIPELQARAQMMKSRYLPKDMRRWVYKTLSE